MVTLLVETDGENLHWTGGGLQPLTTKQVEYETRQIPPDSGSTA